MRFCAQLQEYIDRLACSAKELSAASGLSDAVISRYRSGDREPARDSVQLTQLAQGIAKLAQAAGVPGLSREEVTAGLQAAIDEEARRAGHMNANLKSALSVLQVSIAELARALNFDASYLSRILSGQRRPVDVEDFVERTCQFLVRACERNGKTEVLRHLLGDTETEGEALPTLLAEWVYTPREQNSDSVEQFLAKLDAFDLQEYIRAIHFDEIRTPVAPFRFPTDRNYYGLEQMKQGELDFLKATVLSRSTGSVFMCSDMPMADMAEDMDFGKKWMFGIAAMLKKGLHLDIIHNIDRPFEEMMLGLESWIPIYMTGQVAPYYLRGVQNSVYGHLHYVSGAAALVGECVEGFHADGKYHLSNNRESLTYYRRKAEQLLGRAQPLMEIYREPSARLLRAFLHGDSLTAGKRQNRLCSLPLYTMPEALFWEILHRSGIDAVEAAPIFEVFSSQKEEMERILRESCVTDEVPWVEEVEFARRPLTLSLAEAFYEKEIPYTYAEYRKHWEATLAYQAAHPRYTVRVNAAPAFWNIQIRMHEGQWVMVSKNKAPAIHFVIRHSKMLRAFERLTLPVVEPNELAADA